jgi:hypothetical protein
MGNEESTWGKWKMRAVLACRECPHLTRTRREIGAVTVVRRGCDIGRCPLECVISKPSLEEEAPAIFRELEAGKEHLAQRNWGEAEVHFRKASGIAKHRGWTKLAERAEALRIEAESRLAAEIERRSFL